IQSVISLGFVIEPSNCTNLLEMRLAQFTMLGLISMGTKIQVQSPKLRNILRKFEFLW
ncbi:hypothetical protein PanWU01x14_329460, partial [Parasponia andersonii]